MYLLTRDYLYAEQVVYQEEQEIMLLVSYSIRSHYHFSKFIDHSYTFLDTQQNSVFLHINQFGGVSKYGHIYVSDYTGTKFQLLSKIIFNILSLENLCDFEKIEGLEGIFIANVIDSEYMKEVAEEIDREAL